MNRSQFHSADAAAELPATAGLQALTVWQVWADDTFTPEDALLLSAGDGGFLRGRAPCILRTDGTTGFADAAGALRLASGAGHRVIVRGLIRARGGQTVPVGTSAEWYYQLNVNGKAVFSCLTEGNGVMDGPFSHVVRLPLEEGENIITFFIQGGNRGLYFHFLPLPEPLRNTAFRKGLNDYHFPPEPVLRTLPLLTEMTGSSVTISVEMKTEALIRLKYRRAGTKQEFAVIRNAVGGLFHNDSFQQFRLSGLRPGTRYEYEIEASPDYREFSFRAGPFFFSTDDPDQAEHMLLLTGDTQFSAAETEKFFAKLTGGLPAEKPARFIHLGDIRNDYAEFHGFTDGYLTAQQKYIRHDVPCVWLRGNHEYSGAAAAVFPGRYGKTYGSFVLGQVFYLVLDTGWDLEGTGSPFPAREDLDAFIREEKRWLTEAVKSPAWKKARYHVVLAHATPGFDFSASISRYVETLVKDLFLGKAPAYRIDLWLCGHTHWAARLDTATQKYLVPYLHPGACFPETGGGYARLRRDGSVPDYICPVRHFVRFPVIAVNGPNIVGKGCSFLELRAGADGLHLRHIFPPREIFDEIVIGKNGKTTIAGTTLKPVAEFPRPVRSGSRGAQT